MPVYLSCKLEDHSREELHLDGVENDLRLNLCQLFSGNLQEAWTGRFGQIATVYWLLLHEWSENRPQVKARDFVIEDDTLYLNVEVDEYTRKLATIAAGMCNMLPYRSFCVKLGTITEKINLQEEMEKKMEKKRLFFGPPKIVYFDGKEYHEAH